MKVIIQKCLKSSVSVNKEIISSIDKGLMILVGFTHSDSKEDIDYLVRKIVNLRIFEDENNVMNKSILDEKGEILCISQFTLYANTKKGNRPSYIEAMKGPDANEFYDLFCEKLNNYIPTKKGVFGADMKVSLINDGPTTIVIDSKNKN